MPKSDTLGNGIFRRRIDGETAVLSGAGRLAQLDPNCPYCRKLYETLRGIDNVTVYTFLLNILSDDSALKSKNIWCAADRAQAWARWMDESKPAPVAPAACVTPNEQVLALGKKLHLVGTPTIYFADGSRSGSGFDVATLEARLGR